MFVRPLTQFFLVFVGIATDKAQSHRHLASSPKECQILGDFFGYVVQGLLFGICVGSLVLKWQLEVPKRKWRIFLLDSSKQIVGAGLIHVLNMICATLFSGVEDATADECAWYWVNIMIDTTFGVLICYWILKLTERLFGYESGNYGKGAQTGIDWENNPDYGKWGKQISVWCAIVSMMKCIVVVIMWLFSDFWEKTAILATHWIEDKKWRLIFVMVVTPTCMNMFQFWVTDSFLKWKKKGGEDEKAPLNTSSA